MSRTKHHGSPKKARLLMPDSEYTGWTGECCWKQLGRRYIARLEHRLNRRWGAKEVVERVLDAVHGVDVPLPFEREDYVPAQPKLPTVQRWRKRPLIRQVV